MQAEQCDGPAILLIEDDLVISDLLAEYLREEEYVVTTAMDGPAALDALASRSFALIVTDALAEQRPPIERWSQLAAIRRAARGVPIIICTAHRAEHFADYAARGFSALITKPFDLEELLGLIVHTIDSDIRSGMGMNAGHLDPRTSRTGTG